MHAHTPSVSPLVLGPVSLDCLLWSGSEYEWVSRDSCFSCSSAWTLNSIDLCVCRMFMCVCWIQVLDVRKQCRHRHRVKRESNSEDRLQGAKAKCSMCLYYLLIISFMLYNSWSEGQKTIRKFVEMTRGEEEKMGLGDIQRMTDIWPFSSNCIHHLLFICITPAAYLLCGCCSSSVTACHIPDLWL